VKVVWNFSAAAALVTSYFVLENAVDKTVSRGLHCGLCCLLHDMFDVANINVLQTMTWSSMAGVQAAGGEGIATDNLRQLSTAQP
jgi:hypothetical protein